MCKFPTVMQSHQSHFYRRVDYFGSELGPLSVKNKEFYVIAPRKSIFMHTLVLFSCSYRFI